MGILWSCCCGGERDGIANEPLLRDPDIYAPSNVSDQYNNPRNVSTSNMVSGDGPEANGSLRQIGNINHSFLQLSVMKMNYYCVKWISYSKC